ncbi:hypothetical protein Celaphus_00007220, partial [Cervus elaphus hippelaphus]
MPLATAGRTTLRHPGDVVPPSPWPLITQADRRPGNLPEGRLSSWPAPEKSFEQERQERSREGDQRDQNSQP